MAEQRKSKNVRTKFLRIDLPTALLQGRDAPKFVRIDLPQILLQGVDAPLSLPRIDLRRGLLQDVDGDADPPFLQVDADARLLERGRASSPGYCCRCCCWRPSPPSSSQGCR